MQPGIEHCEPGQGVASNRVKRGRRSTLSEVTILEIRRLARLDPSTWHKKSLAHRFNSQPEVIEHILRGTYWTQAMKTALTAETSTANAPRRPLTQ